MNEYIQDSDWYKKLARKESLEFRKRVDGIPINALSPSTTQPKTLPDCSEIAESNF